MTIQQFQQWFEERFIKLLEQKTRTFLEHSGNEKVKDILLYIPTYSKGGKHFRPYMVYVGYTVEGGGEDIFPLLAAIELLHLFCLVHDDIIDNEETRHDIETMHRKFAGMYQSREIGRSVAMLAGDLLLAWAMECMHDAEIVEPYTIDDAGKEFRILLAEVLHGQLLDVLLITEANPSKELISKSMYLKSAQYSFFRPLYIGMLLAGADPEVYEFAEEYAINLGMAFQLQDDIDDVLEDIKEGQRTILSWYMFNRAPDDDFKEFELYFSKNWSYEEEKKLMHILEHSGALAYMEQMKEDYFLQAEDAIFNFDRNNEEIWLEIIDMVRGV